MKFFKPEDFPELVQCNPQNALYAVGCANAKLEKALGPEVTGQILINGAVRFFGNEPENIGDTHTAQLFNVQELKPKICEHEPYKLGFRIGGESTVEYKCKKCGVKLKAKWEVVE